MPPTADSTSASLTMPQQRDAAFVEALPAPPLQALLDGPSIDELIRLRAYDLYERRGRVDGQALDDWLAAESLVGGH